jgi:rhodanese-related sulfurtransferase
MNRMTELFISMLAITIFVLTTLLAVRNHFNVPVIKSKDYAAWVTQYHPILIDLREGTEAEKMPIQYQPVIHMPFLFLEQRLDRVQFPQNHTVLFVCSDGNRARLIAYQVHDRGMDAYYLESGLDNLPSNSKE